MWSCSCGCPDNYATRPACRGCKREAPAAIRARAKGTFAQAFGGEPVVTVVARGKVFNSGAGKPKVAPWVQGGAARGRDQLVRELRE